MADVNPTVLRRTLMLRQFPLFAGAGLDELATMAENLASKHYPAGSVIAPVSTRLPSIHFVLSGMIASVPSGQTWSSRQVFGALEVAAGRPIGTAAVAAADTETLQLSASDFGEVLEDNFGVLLSALRDLAKRITRIGGRRPPSELAVPGSVQLDLVQRLILLRQQTPFSTAGLHALSTLAHASDEVMWSAGSELWRPGEPATHGFVVVEGGLELRRGSDVVQVLEPGDQVGYLETLADVEHASTLVATTRTRTLRSSGIALLDMLEDHTDVGLAMIAAFSSALLDANVN